MLVGETPGALAVFPDAPPVVPVAAVLELPPVVVFDVDPFDELPHPAATTAMASAAGIKVR
jgi:hypothetical protein